jgi:DNA-binding response OmpR family regulator
MPYNSGLEVVQHIRKHFGSSLPVIVISNINLEETKLHAMNLGALVYMTKPFNPDDLIVHIQNLTSN